MLTISAVYLDQQKSFIPKKNELSQESTGFNIKTTNFVYQPDFGVKILFRLAKESIISTLYAENIVRKQEELVKYTTLDCDIVF